VWFNVRNGWFTGKLPDTIRAMNAIKYLFLRLWLYLFFAAVTSPILFLSGFMIRYVNTHEQLGMLRWVFLSIGLAWIFGVRWLANRAAQRMAFENRYFGEAVKSAFYDVRLLLAFLPMIGPWFEPKSRTDDNKDDNDEN
jgi:hypothetical protein